VAPSALAFTDDYPMPRALSVDGIKNIVSAFAAAARRACDAGFRVIEIHAAHGYLIHEFLSLLSNQRTDAYGGSFENRTRILREIVAAVRASWPERAPLFVSISATDCVDGGWDLQQSVELARSLKELGADLIDCSSGGNVLQAKIPAGPGYQTRFAEQIRREAKNADRRGRDDHFSSSSRARPRYGTGGGSHHRPRISARSILAIAGSR
jgi:2,4-dienoyl-CoA reductase-like NADH-dependent reductase (Old Yellow Enzyme family)